MLTLGIGIGVNTAVFTVCKAAALRPIQMVEPDVKVSADRALEVAKRAASKKRPLLERTPVTIIRRRGNPKRRVTT
jgi:hypothetical protein